MNGSYPYLTVAYGSRRKIRFSNRLFAEQIIDRRHRGYFLCIFNGYAEGVFLAANHRLITGYAAADGFGLPVFIYGSSVGILLSVNRFLLIGHLVPVVED